MDFNKELLIKAKAAKSVEELVAVAGECGLTVTVEQAKVYFDQFHSEDAELSDEELDNVSGGSECVGGRTYSDDWPYYLITTMFNSCSNFQLDTNHDFNVKWCSQCESGCLENGVLYCLSRKRDNDPYK